MDNLNRIKELSGCVTNSNKTKSFNSLYENSTKDGINFCIIQESNTRFVIYVNNNDNLILPDGLPNKHKYTKRTLKEAKRQIDGMVYSFNEAYDQELIDSKFITENKSIVKEKKFYEENIFEDDRYVLKVDAPQTEELGGGLDDTFSDSQGLDLGDESFSDDLDGLDSNESLDTGSDLDFDTEATGDTEQGDNDADPKKSIQKWVGKTAHKLREYKETDRNELDNLAFKSIVAALDWKNVTQDQVDDYISTLEDKFEENAQEGDIGGEGLDDLGGDSLDSGLDSDLGLDDNLDSGLDDNLGLDENYFNDEELDQLFEKFGYCPLHGKQLNECGCQDHEEEEEEFMLLDDEEDEYYEY